MNLTETRPVERLTTGPNDVDHYSCCDPDVALCGFDLSGFDYVDEEDYGDECPICADLYRGDAPCTVPGCPSRVGLFSRLARWFS